MTRARHAQMRMLVLFLLVFVVGCGGDDEGASRIRSVSVTNTMCTDGVCGLPRLTSAAIEVAGEGLCTFRLVLGNGSFLHVNGYDFSQGSRIVQFGYGSSWPGPKTIRAVGEGACVGSASTLHHVFTDANGREDWQIGWHEPRELCRAVPVPPPGGPFPALRPATRVRITAPTTPVVAFGTWTRYDPDGQPGSSAPASFSFPGFRKYSLIVKVGNETFQGGTSTAFTVAQGGEMLLCQNDDEWRDNRGGWQVNILVDESQAP